MSEQKRVIINIISILDCNKTKTKVRETRINGLKKRKKKQKKPKQVCKNNV
jgi:hypothetical protein